MRCFAKLCVASCVLAAGLGSGPAAASDALSGWIWKAESKELNPEGVFWNDFLGDGKDRWKSGGLTQSYTFPERIFDTDPWTPWFENRASGIEGQVRGLVITPDNTSVEGHTEGDRPYAQYLGLGVHLRSDKRPRPAALGTSLGVEDRVGVEVGWVGEPLFLFDMQDRLHESLGMDETNVSDENSVSNGWLVNLEGRRTWRFHRDMGAADVQVAPYADAALGLRENSLRVGGDILVGNALAGRTWNEEPATGAMMPGARPPREGWDWAAYLGGDVGAIGSDALLGGGPFSSGPSIDEKTFVPRARSGIAVGYGPVTVHYGVAYIGPEFEGQDQGQLIGAISVKLPF